MLSVPGIGERTALALILHLPELGQISREEAAALAGLAPFDNDSGQRLRRLAAGIWEPWIALAYGAGLIGRPSGTFRKPGWSLSKAGMSSMISSR